MPAPFASPRKSALYSAHCPFCQAGHGQPCRNSLGQPLAGVHFQRETQKRKAIAAALYLYAPAQRQP